MSQHKTRFDGPALTDRDVKVSPPTWEALARERAQNTLLAATPTAQAALEAIPATSDTPPENPSPPYSKSTAQQFLAHCMQDVKESNPKDYLGRWLSNYQNALTQALQSYAIRAHVVDSKNRAEGLPQFPQLLTDAFINHITKNNTPIGKPSNAKNRFDFIFRKHDPAEGVEPKVLSEVQCFARECTTRYASILQNQAQPQRGGI